MKELSVSIYKSYFVYYISATTYISHTYTYPTLTFAHIYTLIGN